MIVLQAATNGAGEGVREDIVLGLLIDTESRSSCCRPERVGRNRGAGVGHVHGGFGVLVQERYPPYFFSFFFFLTSRFLLLILSFFLLFSLPLPFLFFFLAPSSSLHSFLFFFFFFFFLLLTPRLLLLFFCFAPTPHLLPSFLP